MELSLHILAFILVFVGARHLILAREKQQALQRNRGRQNISELLEGAVMEIPEELLTPERAAFYADMPLLPTRPEPATPTQVGNRWLLQE